MAPFMGRKRIMTSETEITRENLLDVLAKTEPVFRANRGQIRYLHRYFLGDQVILKRRKEVRPEICNRPVENHFQEIVNFYVGYITGQPAVYVRDGDDTGTASEAIQTLNKMMQFEGKASSDRMLMQWACEVGVGYRIILPDSRYSGDLVDECPFFLDTLDSDMTYVVRNSGIGHRVVMGVLHTPRDGKSDLIVVYTPKMYFEVDGGEITKAEPHILGGVPIIEYELNPERMGAAEPVLPILDAINNIAANRLDGLEQFVQSFMKFVNCEIDEEKFESFKSKGAIAIKSTSQLPADVDIITTELDQQQSQVLVDYLLDQMSAISGMPSTKGGTASTSDNVGAVIVRNGWNQTEARAQQIESMFKRGEQEFLRVALTILEAQTNLRIRLSDVDIRFPRRQYENLQSKAQVLSQLLSLPIDPEIAFKYPGLFPDPQCEFEASKKYLANAGRYWEGDTPPEPPAGDDTSGNEKQNNQSASQE